MNRSRPRRIARILAALVVGMVTTPLASAIAADETVVITTTLEPKTLTVTPGTTVMWVNEDGDEHRMRSDTGPEKFDSGNLAPGESFTFNFALEGTYPYIDDRNDSNTAYHGTIIVTADAPPPDPGDPPPPPPAAGDVTIVDRSYSPGSITVAAGATVTWANNDNEQHTVTANDASWDSGIFDQGGTYSRSFAAAGTYPYFCVIHPDMTGTVVVVAGDGTAPPPPSPPPSPPAPPAPPAPSPPPAPGDVNIVDFAFDPVSLTVAQGATVTWANAGAAPHTVTANSGSFDSGLLFAGDTFSRTFAAAGTFAYFCTLHPEMTATILVTGAGGAPPPPGDPAPPPGGDPLPPPGGGTAPVPVAGGIAIVDNAYSPASRTITTGTTLVWTNTGAIPHTVTASGGGFDSGVLLSGGTYRRTFTQPGTFDYFCTIHPTMKGTVTVTGAPTGPAPLDEGGAATGAGGGDLASAGGPSSVAIFDNGYRPGDVTIPAGSQVSWSNTGAIPHTVTDRDGSFDSGILLAGDGYSRRFTTPGIYEYFCTIHPGMVGTVTVTEATGPIDESLDDESLDAAAPGGEGEGSDLAADSARGPAVVRRNVRIVDNDFAPRSLTIEAGQAVRWTNAGAIPHTVTANDGTFDSGLIETQGSFDLVFAEEGSYEYFCTLHPDMVGIVEVVAPAPAVLSAGAGAGAAGPSDAVAFILAGSIVAAVGAFSFGMVQFGKAAARDGT